MSGIKNLSYKVNIVQILAGILVGLVVQYFISSYSAGELQKFHYVGLMTFLLISIILILFLFNRIISKTERNHLELKKVILADSSKTFKLIDKTEVFELASSKIKYATTYRVTGNLRQDEWVSVKMPSEIVNYMRNIEKRCRYDKSKKFTYKRITNGNLKSSLYDHMHKCLEIKEKSRKNISLVIDNELDLEYTYMIFDEDFMILNLNRFIDDSSKKEQDMCFFTSDKRIISGYIKRFDKTWKKGNKIKDLDSFKKIAISLKALPKDERGLTKKFYFSETISNIKYYLECIKSESTVEDQVFEEINHSYERIKRIAEWDFVIDHLNNTSDINHIFINYLNKMDDSSSYRAIALLEFYNNLESIQEFIGANEKALQRDAEIRRIFIVDGIKYRKNSQYQKSISEIFKRNYDLCNSYSNYHFDFLVSADYSYYKKNTGSFTIWQKSDETLLFLPDHMGPTPKIYKTRFKYIDFQKPNHPKFNNNLGYLKELDDKFKEAEEIAMQDDSDIKEEILSKII